MRKLTTLAAHALISAASVHVLHYPFAVTHDEAEGYSLVHFVEGYAVLSALTEEQAQELVSVWLEEVE